jgi:hypothetical protein
VNPWLCAFPLPLAAVFPVACPELNAVLSAVLPEAAPDDPDIECSCAPAEFVDAPTFELFEEKDTHCLSFVVADTLQ